MFMSNLGTINSSNTLANTYFPYWREYIAQCLPLIDYIRNILKIGRPTFVQLPITLRINAIIHGDT